jgi:ketosteroid isomerase-like protein
MSQENVEFLVDYLQRGTDGGVDAVAEFWDPDITWRPAEGAIDDVGEMHGPEAVRRYIEDWFDMFDDLTVVADELVDAGDDRVVAVHRMTGRAKISGIETEIRFSSSTPCATERSCRGASTWTRSRPSQPWGCGSRSWRSPRRGVTCPAMIRRLRWGGCECRAVRDPPQRCDHRPEGRTACPSTSR